MKKSLWLKTLALVLIVAMMSVMFVACKKDGEDSDKEPSTPSTTIEAADVTDLIFEGLANAVRDEKLSELNMGAELTVKANEEEYKIQLGVILDLLEVGDKNKDNTYNITSCDTMVALNVTDKDNTQLFNAYYADAKVSSNLYSGDRLYVAYKNADGTMTKSAIKAPFVKNTMAAQNGFVWDKEINDGAMDLIEDTIPGKLTMVAGILGKNPVIAADKKSCSLDIPLTDLIDPSTELGQTIAGLNVDNYLTSLGISGPLSSILNTLPSIAIKISATFDKDDALSGLKLGLELGKTTQNMVVKHANNTDLINIAISKDISVELGFKFAMGAATTYMVTPASVSDYNEVSALNAELTADFVVDKAVDNRINLNGDGSQYLSIIVPQGTYSAYVALDIDPTKLLGAVFTKQVPTYYMDGATKRYIDKDNDKVSYTEITEANKDKIKQSSVANVGGIIDGVYNAINYVELSIKNDTRTLINVKAYKDGGSLCIEKLNIDMIKDSVLPVVSVGVLEGLQGHTYDLAALLNVLGLGEMGEKEHEVANPNPSTSGSASGTPTNSIDDTLKDIKPYIDGLRIKIDSNGLDVGYSASFGNASKGEVVTDLTASLTINSAGFAANVITKNSATEEHYKLDLAATIKNINFKYGTAEVPTSAA